MKNSSLLSVIYYDGKKIVVDKKSDKISNDTKLYSMSISKSFVSYILGNAICNKYIKSINDKISMYVPETKGTLYENSTFRDLINMSAGDINFSNRKPGSATFTYVDQVIVKKKSVLELEIKQLISERSEPFQLDVVSIQDTWDYLKKEKNIRGRINDVSTILNKLGGVKLGECKHIYSGRKPTLWIIRNKELYGPLSKSEIAKRCWMPKCYWKDTDDGDPTKHKFSQNPKMVWDMNEYNLLEVKAWYRDEVTAFEKARGDTQEDDRPMFEIWRDE